MSGDQRAIGVFDSGIGGLTVLRVLQARFPSEHFIYLGDTARLPYGSKSAQTIRKYSEQNLRALVAQGVKAIVIACNTASTQMREPLIDGIPIYNTIGPGAKAALSVSSRKRIGLIGTRATIASRAYEEEIRNLDPVATVVTQACPLMVPLAEEGWDGDPVTNLIVYRYLQTLLADQIDTLILGCTHYPLLEGSIARVTGSAITLVDSGEAIAAAMKHDQARGIWSLRDDGDQSRLRVLLTDGSSNFQDLSKRILGQTAPTPELVDL